MRKLTAISAVCVLALFCFAARAMADASTDCANVKTDKGLITGTADEKNNVCAFKGIPYAAAPVGELRFTRPVEHAPWKGVLETTKLGNECLQFPMSLFPAKSTIGAEDCLYMNVTSPRGFSAGAKKPVMFFIHGGGFTTGSANWPLYDGAKLAARGDVVVVTINYRLAAFGFMVHPAMRDREGFIGNYGLHDQIAALIWVKNNIANFGGDLNNVTIFGESAGGMSVGLLLLSPLAKGLFHRAVIQSGPVVFSNKDEKVLESVGKRIADKLGCADEKTALVCLRKIDAVNFVEGTPPSLPILAEDESGGKFAFEAVVDGKLVPETPYAMLKAGKIPAIPLMIGSNTDEASYFILSKKLDTAEQFDAELKSSAESIKGLGLTLDMNKVNSLFPLSAYPSPRAAFSAMLRDMAFTCPSRMVAEAASKSNRNVYLYLFGKAPDEKGMMKSWGAFHGAELPFIFQNFEFLGMKFATKANADMGEKTMAYWVAFARTGAPEPAGLPKWPAFNGKTREYLSLNADIAPGANFRAAECDYFDSLFANK